MSSRSMLGVAVLGAALLLLSPARSMAQDREQSSSNASSSDETSGDRNIVEPSDKQLELNNKAVRQIVKGDYAAAVALLEESLTLGKLNVTYLNLARAYQKLERCEDADRALDRAQTAPAIEEPSPEVVDKKAREYRRSLAEVCDSVDPPGTENQEVAETTTKPSPSDPDTSTTPPSDDQSRSAGRTRRMWGWIAVGGAGLFGGGGAAFHLVARSQRSPVTNTQSGEVIDSVTQREARKIQQRSDRLDTLAVVSAGVGAAALGTGLYLLLSPERSASGASNTPRASIQLQPRGAAFSISMDF